MTWLLLLLIVLIKFFLTLAAIAIGERQFHYYVLHGRAFGGWPARWHAYEHHGLGENKWWHINLSPIDYFLTFPLIAFSAWRYFAWGYSEGLTGLIAVPLACLTHMVLWNYSHRAIHGLEPNNWASKLPWYETVRDNHLAHHNDPSIGLSVVFPFLDRWLHTDGRS